MESFDVVNADESAVAEFLQRSSADRAILYFAFGLSEIQTSHFFNDDWCSELNLSSSKVGANHFGLVDEFPSDDGCNDVRYRALFMLDCIRSQFAQGDGRLAELALLRRGEVFDLFKGCDSLTISILRNPLFACPAMDIHRRAGKCKGNKSDKQKCSDFHENLVDFYDLRDSIVVAIEALSDSDCWFIRREIYPSEAQDEKPIIISFMLRHATDNKPEIIIAIEHTIVEVNKIVADALARDYNCDSYVERYDTCELILLFIISADSGPHPL